MDNEAGDTDRRCGCKKSIDKRNVAGGCAEGKEQEQCANQDGDDKANGQDLGRLEQLLFIKVYRASPRQLNSPIPLNKEESIICLAVCQLSQYVPLI